MHGFAKRGTWIGVLVVLVSAVSVNSADAATKPYLVIMSGAAGTNGLAASATITNETKTQQLGSANLTAPSGYVVSSASTTQGTATPVFDSTRQRWVIELRSVSLAPGAKLTIMIGLSSVPCTSSTWSIEAKQANDFSGPPGNDLNLDPQSVLTTTLCAANFTNGTATTQALLAGGKAQVAATATGAGGQLLESGDLATVSPLDCSGYTTADPNTYGVITAGVDASKVVTLTISSPTIPLVGNASQILKSQQICFEAPYEFTTSAGTPAVNENPGPPPNINGPFIGLLQTCTGSTVGPCHNRQADSVITDPVTRKVTGVVLVADIPSGLPGDPRMG